MDYEGVNSIVCDAEESDWLDVSYTERKYVPKKSATKKIKWNKTAKFVLIGVLCVAFAAALLFADGNFQKDVFNAVKTASASVFVSSQQSKTENKINIPCNLTLLDVNDGIMTFGGGRAALCLADGTVSEVTADSVVVKLDDDTSIAYYDIATVYVQVGDVVSQNSLLGKYQDKFTACILENGQVVTQVVGSETQLTWAI